jgi:hypothetical protein
MNEGKETTIVDKYKGWVDLVASKHPNVDIEIVKSAINEILPKMKRMSPFDSDEVKYALLCNEYSLLLHLGIHLTMELDKETVLRVFEFLNGVLAKQHLAASIKVYGGAAMMLVCLDTRMSNDIDVIVSTKEHKKFWDAVRKTAQHFGLPELFFDEAIMSIVAEDLKRDDTAVHLTLSNLEIKTPKPEQLLAMKLFSARLDESSKDLEDAVVLCKDLSISKRPQLIGLLEQYVRKDAIQAQNRKKGRHNCIHKFIDELERRMLNELAGEVSESE